jgi:hypothetical protein
MTLVHLAQIPDHPALVALDWCRIDPQGISLEAELQAAPGQRDYLGGPGQVLGWQQTTLGQAPSSRHFTITVRGGLSRQGANLPAILLPILKSS